jgi:FAD/FMN-containing dehydrogenase
MGWLSRRLGLTIDNLLGADVVTADSRLIRTSAEEEPDLFWAVRGGGGNFGVVTSFRFQMHPLGPVSVGRWVYPARDAAAVLRRFRSVAANARRELATAFTLTSAELVITAFWSGASDRSEETLAPFGMLDRHPSGSMGRTTFLALQSRGDEHFAWGRRYYAKGGFLADLDENAIAAMTESIACAPSRDTEVYVLQLGGAVADIVEGGTPYTGRDAAYYWIVEPVWDDKVDDERCIAWGRKAAAQLAAISLRGNYVNEQSEVGKDVAFSAYGKEKYDRLAKIKFRYDPSNLFRLNQNIEARA